MKKIFSYLCITLCLIGIWTNVQAEETSLSPEETYKNASIKALEYQGNLRDEYVKALGYAKDSSTALTQAKEKLSSLQTQGSAPSFGGGVGGTFFARKDSVSEADYEIAQLLVEKAQTKYDDDQSFIIVLRGPEGSTGMLGEARDIVNQIKAQEKVFPNGSDEDKISAAKNANEGAAKINLLANTVAAHNEVGVKRQVGTDEATQNHINAINVSKPNLTPKESAPLTTGNTLSNDYQLLAPIPLGDTNTPTESIDVPGYIKGVFTLSITLCAIFAILMIVIAGFEYITTEKVSSKKDANERIQSAIYGLLLVLASYLLLNTINPDFVNFDAGLKISIKSATDQAEALKNQQNKTVTAPVITDSQQPKKVTAPVITDNGDGTQHVIVPPQRPVETPQQLVAKEKTDARFSHDWSDNQEGFGEGWYLKIIKDGKDVRYGPFRDQATCTDKILHDTPSVSYDACMHIAF